MRRLLDLVVASHLSVLIRLACLCAGLSLLFMVLLVTVRIPLVTVLGMGVAHGFGILGVVLFAAAVLKDAMRSASSRKSSLPPAAPRTSKPPPS
jgi:hypothetical protein